MKFPRLLAIALSIITLSFGVIACGGKSGDNKTVPVAGGGGAGGAGGAGADGTNSSDVTASDSKPDSDTDSASADSKAATGGSASGPKIGTVVIAVISVPGSTADSSIAGVTAPIGVSPTPPIAHELKMGTYRGKGIIRNDMARVDSQTRLADREANIAVTFSRNESKKQTVVTIKTNPADELRAAPIVGELTFVSRDTPSKMVIWSDYPNLVDVSKINLTNPYAPTAIDKLPLPFTNRGEGHSADCDDRNYHCHFKATNLLIGSFTGEYRGAEISGELSYNPDHAEISLDLQTKAGSNSLERI